MSVDTSGEYGTGNEFELFVAQLQEKENSDGNTDGKIDEELENQMNTTRRGAEF